MKKLPGIYKNPLRNLEGQLPFILDAKTGILNKLEEVKIYAGDPEYFHFAAAACNTEAFVREPNFMDSGGASIYREIAMAKAIGEAIERYSSAIFAVEDLPICSYEEAPFECVHPSKFNFFSTEQYERPGFIWVPFDEYTAIRWTPSVEWSTKKQTYVPAASVYMPYMFYQGTGDSPICQPISTGLACHASFEAAAAGGICEVIERDAFTIFWQAKLAPPQIRTETLSDENYDRAMRFERNGSRVTLFDITMDNGVCCVLAVLVGNSEKSPARVFAASADLNPEVAVAKALEELAHTRRYSFQLKNKMAPITPNYPDHEEVEGQVGHLLFYTNYENAKLADYVFSSKKKVDFSSLQNYSTGTAAGDLETLVARVKATGEEVYLCDLTSDDVRELGLSVVRAIVPGYHPLRMGHVMRSLGGTRLWEVPQKLGYKGITREEGDNPLPHPYP